MTFEKSVNIPKFKIYIEELRARYFFDDLVIYMDNLAVHRSNVIRDRLNELGIAFVYNAPYSPEFNPIETVFSFVKANIKKKRM